jgi:CRP-like cAMP-binding protein
MSAPSTNAFPWAVECPTCPLHPPAGGCPLRIERVSDGDVLLEADEPPRHLVHIKGAAVELVATNFEGDEQRYTLRGPGALVGWEALSGGPCRSEVRVVNSQPAAARVARYLLGDIRCVSGVLDGKTARSIARQLGIRHETLSRVLQRLEVAGMIERSPLMVLDAAGLRRVVRTGRV